MHEHGANISVKRNHQQGSIGCSGDIVSIQLLCKCENDADHDDKIHNISSAMSVSYDVSVSILFESEGVEGVIGFMFSTKMT